MHLAQIHHHMGYEIPAPTKHIHLLSSSNIPFHRYDPWATLAAGDQLNRGDANTADYDPSDTF